MKTEKPSLGIKVMKILLSLGIIICCNPIITGQTVVKGRITDAVTFEPVVFANVVFKGTVIGAKTGFDGTFLLTGVTQSDSIVISFIGYETITRSIIKGASQNAEIMLHPATYSLNEVMVKPGENPAHKILRKVWENRDSNKIQKNNSYQYDNYSRLTVFFRKFRAEANKKGLYKKEFQEYGIKTGEDESSAIPAFINETFSTTYFLKTPERTFTEINAINTSGISFDKTDLVSQLFLKQENIDLSGNNVLIADKNFITPLSRSGLMYYKYYLVDSMFIDNYFSYEIRIVPKREEDPVFSGTMWINDTTFALKRISVEISDKAEINFLERIKIQQDYDRCNTGSWLPVRTRFMADAVNIFFTNFSEKSNISINKYFDPGFYSSEIKIDPEKTHASSEFWSSKRTSTLDHTDSLAIIGIDSLRENRKVRTSAKLVEASIRSFYDFGKIEAGPLVMIYNYNPVEGNRFRIGGRTNTDFSRILYLEGYLAYGTHDNNYKGSAQAEVFLSKKTWTKLGFQYRDDLEKTGSADQFYSGDSFMSFASSFGGWDKINSSVVKRAWFETDLAKSLSGKIYYSQKTFDPVSPDLIFAWLTNPLQNESQKSYISSELGLTLRYQPRAVYIIDGLRRFPVNFNKFPAINFSYSRGIKGFAGSNFDFDKIGGGISNDFSMGGLGRFVFDFKYSKVIGSLPYPLLINPSGNESIFYSGHMYNLMNYGEFVADEAFELFMDYHMDGLIMNRIPIIKKLHLRTVLSAHLFSGSCDKANGFYDSINNPEGILPVSFNGTLLTSFIPAAFNKPYAELSYGIENIFNFMRIDLVQRLTWLDNPDARRFGVKISGDFRF